MKQLLLSTCVLISLTLHSQTWQWGKRVGGNYTSGSGFPTQEEPYDITTDNKGNTYVIGQVFPNGLVSVDTHTVHPYISYAGNVLLTSYRCDGTYRWSKMLGTGSGSWANAVKTDTLGGVYIAAQLFVYGNSAYMDADSTTPASNKSMFIIKYDTAGNFKWYRNPESDTITYQNSWNNSTPMDMCVDKAGTVSLLAAMPPGNNLNGTLPLTTQSTYILKYDRNGTFLSAIPLLFKYTGLRASNRLSTRITQSKNGNYIISGYRYYTDYDTLLINNDTLRENTFVACFNNNGQYLWKQTIHSPNLLTSNGIIRGRAATDNNNGIYVTGYATRGDTLAGYVFTNPVDPNALPMLVKLTANGALAWGQNADVNAATVSYGIALSGNTVAISGAYPGTMQWHGSSSLLHHIANQGYAPFIALFNAQTGAFINQDSLVGLFGYNERANGITSDSKGNFYVTGFFDPYMYVAGSALQSAGHEDWFFAKYGTSNCNFNSTAGVNDVALANAEELTVYPNPGEGNLILHFNKSIPEGEWCIYNLLGEKIMTEKIKNVASEYSQHIQLNQSSGIYFIKLTVGNEVFVKKYIVE